ncbi:hypothetical protein BXZ70DRAFT_915484 [Cristinia sonorae]|uniref:Uncharacterized protein n=1 Tax=Cristinia sonorae TaxID=1940300 RepID=A0A8K0UY64_9AGAR|nr:hypothetical protein BXZ70DRAFT_915484 [Cristinia sonorae]
MDFVSASLQRSGSMPLRITWRSSSPSPYQFIEATTSHSSRIEGLDFEASNDRLVSLLGNTRFPLNNTVFIRLAKECPLTNHSSLFRPVLHNSPCRLRTLELHAVAIPWDCPLINAHLRSLRISNLSEAHRPGLPDFIGLLQRCTSLEELVVDRAGPRPYTTSDRDIPTVELPHLLVFQLINRPRQCPTDVLLSHIILPETTQVDISVEMKSDRDGTVTFAACLPHDPSDLAFLRTVAAIHVGFQDEEFIELQADSPQSRFRLRILSPYPHIYVKSCIEEVGGIFCRSSSQTLSFSSSLLCGCDTIDWRTLRPLTELKALAFTRDPANGLFTTSNVEAVLIRALSLPILPHLERLEFCGMALTSEAICDFNGIRTSLGVSSVMVVSNFDASPQHS